jgi:hypothetical protein
MMRIDEQRVQDFKTVVIFSTLGLGTATGLFFLGRHLYKNIIANSSQKHSLEEGDPATYAKQLKMAFENDNYMGWGTNTDMVKKVFRDIPSKKMYSKVQKEFMRMYSKSLNADLEDELTSDEYNEIIRILNAKK